MQSLVQIGQIAQEEFERVGFSFVVILWMESYRESGPTPHTSAELKEHVDLRFNNVQHIMWELWAKKTFTCKIAKYSAACWSFLVCELQWPF